MEIKKLISKIYFDKASLKICDYDKSRKFFIFEGCMAVGISSLTSGAFLAGFTSYLGASDEFAGIIGAIPALTGIIQLFSSIIVERLERRKLLVSIGYFISRMLLSIMVLIPVYFQGTEARLTALAVIYGMAYLISAFIESSTSNWMVDLTPEHLRAAYFARKDAVSLGFITMLTIIMGKVMDLFRNYNNDYGGFLVIGIFVFIMTILDTSFLFRTKEPAGHREIVKLKLKDTIIIPFKNVKYRKVIILFLLYNIGLQIAGPFVSIYMVTGLKLDYTYIMVMGVLTSVARMFSAKYWGRIADKKSWYFSTKLSITILAFCHAAWFLVDNRTVWVLLPIMNVFGGIAWSGVTISIFNIQFVMAPEEGRTMYLGASAALGGLAGFMSTFIGSMIIKNLKSFSIDFAGFNICNMQIVFALSGIILLITALYVHMSISQNQYKLKI